MMGARGRQIAVVVLAVWQIGMAAASQAGLLPGESVGTISDRYDSAVVPAGYAFSIWGLIYVLSLVLAVYQASADRRDDPVLEAVRPPLVVAFLVNGLWLLAFQTEQFVLAQVLIFLLTASLARAYANLARAGRPRTRAERWVVYTTVGTYLGWSTIATVAGASTTLLALGVEDLVLSPEAWAVLLLAVAALIAVVVTVLGPPEPGFPLTCAWALAAIAVEQSSDRRGVAIAAGLAAALALLALAVREYRINRNGHGALQPG